MIYIGSDHAGYELKEKIKIFLTEHGYKTLDKGAHKFDNEDDYPDFIIPVAEAVSKNPDSFGIVLGGSGEGEAMSANRIEGVRAAEYYGGDPEIVKVSRLHNNANILSLGARYISEDDAKEAILLFLETKFKEEERHVRRIKKLESE